jgi:anti-sigma B factor antagonist
MLPGFDITTSEGVDGDGFRVRLRGEADLSTVEQLTDALDRLPPGGRVVIDLTETTFIDSTILRLLLDRASRVRAAGGALEVAVADNSAPRRLIEMVGVAEMLFAQTGSDLTTRPVKAAEN